MWYIYTQVYKNCLQGKKEQAVISQNTQVLLRRSTAKKRWIQQQG